MDPWSLYFIQTSFVFPNVLFCSRTPHGIDDSSCPHGLLWLRVSQACLAFGVFGRLQNPHWRGFVWCFSHDQNETGYWEEDHTNHMPLSLYHIKGAQHHSPGWGRCHCVHPTLQDGGGLHLLDSINYLEFFAQEVGLFSPVIPFSPVKFFQFSVYLKKFL